MPWFISGALIVLGCFLVVFCFHRCFGFMVTVDGSSMCPTFQPKTILYVRAIAPGSVFNRGDIVILDDGNGKVVKRVVGLAGDRVRFVLGQVYINGHQLFEPYLPKGVATYPQEEGHEIRVGSNQYLVLGDNRKVSLDGRSYGPLDVRQIQGLVPYDGPAPRLGPLNFATAQPHVWR